MKVLHIITSLRIGGAETLVASMLPLFRAMGAEKADVAVFDAEETALTRKVEEEGSSLYRLGKGFTAIYSPRRIADLTKLMEEYDIVHTHNTSAQFFAAMAARKMARRPVLVTTEHNTSNRRRSLPLMRVADRRMYGAYAKIVCCSDAVNMSLRDYLHDDDMEGRICTVSNGVNLDRFHALPAGQPGTRLLCVAAFRKQKRQDLLLRALALLTDDFTLTFAGEGETRADAERLAESLGLGKRVRFIGNAEDVAAVMAEHDITVYATRFEGLPLAVVESLASGRPLVATDAPGLTETAGDAAVVVANESPEAIADAVRRLAGSAELYAATAAAGRRRSRRFDVADTARAYYNIYESILNQNIIN